LIWICVPEAHIVGETHTNVEGSVTARRWAAYQYFRDSASSVIAGRHYTAAVRLPARTAAGHQVSLWRPKLSNVPGVVYIEGRVELFNGSQRRVGAWNFGQSMPFIVLNVAPYDGKPEYWAIIPNGPDRLTAWMSSDPNVFVRTDWQQGLTPA
jgi:hypothetical protein